MSKSNEAVPDMAELRKQLKSIEARIGKLARERITVTEQLEKLERACIHNWSNPKPIKGSSGLYERECAFCGKVQKSKPAKVEF